MTSGQTVTFPNDDATRELSVDELDLVAAGEFSLNGLVQAVAVGAATGAANGTGGIPGWQFRWRSYLRDQADQLAPLLDPLGFLEVRLTAPP